MSQTQGKNTAENNKKNIDPNTIADKIVRKNDKVAWRIIEGEVIIITPEDSVQHYINEVGSTVWNLADGNRTVNDIIKLMKIEYKENIEKGLITADQIEQDVLEFIDELSSKDKSIVFLE